jgi:carboxylate-amine ligase
VLLALSANSPYSWGVDTGYASWRSQTWSRWPSAGPPEEFGDAAGYRAATEALIETGAAVDRGMLYFDARLAETYPTIEIRVADVGPEAESAVLIAALARALVETSATAWAAGAPVASVAVGARARRDPGEPGRDGLSGKLVHPEAARLVPAREAVAALVDHVADALVEAGDREQVDALMAQMLGACGATRQRSVFEAHGVARGSRRRPAGPDRVVLSRAVRRGRCLRAMGGAEAT